MFQTPLLLVPVENTNIPGSMSNIDVKMHNFKISECLFSDFYLALPTALTILRGINPPIIISASVFMPQAAFCAHLIE